MVIDFFEFLELERVSKRLSLGEAEVSARLVKPFALCSTSFLIASSYDLKKGNPRITYSAVIRNLLEDSAYFIYHGFFPKRRGKATRTYQKQGLDLKKVSFRVDERYLIEMDLMASALSVSRSHLLGLLLEWREMGWLGMVREFGIVRGTPFLRSIRLIQTYDLKTDRYPTFRAELLHNADSS